MQLSANAYWKVTNDSSGSQAPATCVEGPYEAPGFYMPRPACLQAFAE